MRQIGTLENSRDAQRFSDYLLSKGVPTTVEQDESGWAIWVHQEDHIPQSRLDLEEFRKNPQAPRYAEATQQAERIRQQQEQRSRENRERVIDMRDRWERPSAAHAPLTFLLIAISVLVAVNTRLSGNSPLARKLMIAEPIIDNQLTRWPHLDEVARGEVWRLITPIFLHFGFLHILFNMLWLQSLGTVIETLRGSLRFGIMILVIALTSNVAQYAQSGLPTFGGMSGVVYGLLGYAWMKSRYDPASGIFLPSNIVVWMMAWLVLCMFEVIPNVANTAHAVGLAAGMLIGIAGTLGRRLR